MTMYEIKLATIFLL
uniref:Uncharacterized protein n=1 Tax=Arundo donax TaxID=35708 RepID=A0A0A9BD74_ARUDO